MMGRLKSDQGQLFYEFHLGDAVPEDHLVRKIDTALDLSWLRGAGQCASPANAEATAPQQYGSFSICLALSLVSVRP
jgi:hypothetical protein